MEVYLAGTAPIESLAKRLRGGGRQIYMVDPKRASDVYLPNLGKKYGFPTETSLFKRANVLVSFAYVSPYVEETILPNCRDFLLDSGAFSFMYGSPKSPDWDEYSQNYSAYVKRTGIKKYIELDIDYLVGYPKVKRMRDQLEREVGYPPIPVWHTTRGYKDFLEMCGSYPYISIGGIGQEILPKHFSILPKLIQEAHDYKVKIHGLGFTRTTELSKYHWDSVDSTAWVAGNRFGSIFKFQNGRMMKIDKPEGHRLRDSSETALNNWCEWLKFADYARVKL